MAALIVLCLVLSGCLGPDKAGSLTEKGMEALENKDVQTALADFEQALANGEPAVAIEKLQEALAATDDRMPKTRDDLRMYLVSALQRAGRYDEVLETAELITAGETIAEVCYFKGAACLKKGDTDEARTYFDKAIALLPRDYSLYLQIYETYEDCMLTAVGDEYLQTALSIIPSSDEDYYRVGQIYYYLERYDDARNVLDTPVEHGYAPAIALLGEVYLSAGDYTHAEAVFEEIMLQNTDDPAVYNGLALCAISAGKYDQALSYIEQGLALEGEDDKQQLQFNEIVAYEKKLDFSTAFTKAEAYCALYPTDTDAMKELEFLRTRVR